MSVFRFWTFLQKRLFKNVSNFVLTAIIYYNVCTYVLTAILYYNVCTFNPTAIIYYNISTSVPTAIIYYNVCTFVPKAFASCSSYSGTLFFMMSMQGPSRRSKAHTSRTKNKQVTHIIRIAWQTPLCYVHNFGALQYMSHLLLLICDVYKRVSLVSLGLVESICNPSHQIQTILRVEVDTV